jgi:mRNA degradation ribonuclease J1/J2
VSGHGYQDDLELLLLATRPRTFVALHGTARHLLGHGDLAARVGLREDRIVSLRDGHALAIHDDERLVHEPAARAHEPLARDGHVTWWPRDIVHTRKRMSESGVLVIVDGAVPTLHERGFSEPLDDELTRALIDEARVAFRAIGTPREPAAVRGLARLFWRARRSPPEIILVEAHVQREPARNIQEAPEPALEVIVDT